jgi:predicted RNase H-like nuclease (RuvC/YqgF family)
MITYDDGKEKEQQMVNKDKEIQLLKKELKDAQDMISILSSQIRSKST